MSDHPLTIQLSDDLYDQVQALAEATAQPVEQIVQAQLRAALAQERLPPSSTKTVQNKPDNTHHPLTREEARQILLAAGMLSIYHVPEGTVALSKEELMRIGQLPAGARTSEELVDEDRGEY